MTHMMPASGVWFDLLNPQTAHVSLDDIVAHLRGIRRYAGIGISVLLHSILVSEHLPQHLMVAGLLHDAHEAYMGDITRPAMQALAPSSVEWSHHLQRVVVGAIAPDAVALLDDPRVKIVDDLAAVAEAHALWNSTNAKPHWWHDLYGRNQQKALTLGLPSPDYPHCMIGTIRSALQAQRLVGSEPQRHLSDYLQGVGKRLCTCDRPAA